MSSAVIATSYMPGGMLVAAPTSPANAGRVGTKSSDQSPHRPHVRAVGEDSLRERGFTDAEMIAQDTFQRSAQIRRRGEVTALVEIGNLQPRPVRNHPPALHC